VVESLGDEQLAAVADADYLTFTSSSTVTNLARAAGELPSGPRCVSIGPATTATLLEHGRAPDVEATRHDIEGLIEALVADAASTGSG
jgi:uroporphyrinogen III methyltransferase/synthase